jgi:hypothetical protein
MACCSTRSVSQLIIKRLFTLDIMVRIYIQIAMGRTQMLKEKPKVLLY